MRRRGMKFLLVALALASGGRGGRLCLADEQVGSRVAAAAGGGGGGIESESAARLEQSLEQLKAEREEAVKKEDFAAALDIQNQITLLESMIGQLGVGRGVDLNAGQAPILDIVDDNNGNDNADAAAAAAAAGDAASAGISASSASGVGQEAAGEGKQYNMASLLESLRLHKDKKAGVDVGGNNNDDDDDDDNDNSSNNNNEAGILSHNPVGGEGADTGTSNDGSVLSSDLVADSPAAGAAGLEGNTDGGGDSGQFDNNNNDLNKGAEEERDGSALREWLAANADLLADIDDVEDTVEDVSSVNSSPGDDVSDADPVNLGNYAAAHEKIDNNDDGRLGEHDAAVEILDINANSEDADDVDVVQPNFQMAVDDEDAGHEEDRQHKLVAGSQGAENHESDPCSSDTFSCGANGQCQVIDGDARCICDAGWEGERCTDDVDDCMVAADAAAAAVAAVQDSPCGVHGTCRDIGTNAFLCTCAEGWSGFACEEHDPCLENPCGHHGVCDTLAAPSPKTGVLFDCACHSGWEGARCDQDSDDCAAAPCHGHGTCHDTGTDSFFCACQNGWSGVDCLEEPVCASNPCGGHGACSADASASTGFRCDCDAGWTGELCMSDTDDCTDQALGGLGGTAACGLHGKCTDLGTRAFFCECESGWSGDDCMEHLKTVTAGDQSHDSGVVAQAGSGIVQDRPPAAGGSGSRADDIAIGGSNVAAGFLGKLKNHKVEDEAQEEEEGKEEAGGPVNHWADLQENVGAGDHGHGSDSFVQQQQPQDGGAVEKVFSSDDFEGKRSENLNDHDQLEHQLPSKDDSSGAQATAREANSRNDVDGNNVVDDDEGAWSVQEFLAQPAVLGGLGAMILLLAGVYAFLQRRASKDGAAGLGTGSDEAYERVDSRKNMPRKVGFTNHYRDDGSDDDGDGSDDGDGTNVGRDLEAGRAASHDRGSQRQSSSFGRHVSPSDEDDDDDDGFATDSTGGWGDHGLIDIPLDEAAAKAAAEAEAKAAAERERQERLREERRAEQEKRREAQRARREALRQEREDRRRQAALLAASSAPSTPRESTVASPGTPRNTGSMDASETTNSSHRPAAGPVSASSSGLGARLGSAAPPATATTSKPKKVERPPEPDYFGALGISMDTSTVTFAKPAPSTRSSAGSLVATASAPRSTSPTSSGLFAISPAAASAEPAAVGGGVGTSASTLAAPAGPAGGGGWGEEDDSWEDSNEDEDADATSD